MGYSGGDSTIRLGTQGTQTASYVAGIWDTTATGGTLVDVNSNGQLGTLTSSAKFKRNIHDMGDARHTLLSLRPVTFEYKPEINPSGTPQFGLIAEEVEKVDPNPVVRDAHHQAYTARYEAVNAMLLNEFQKQHATMVEQGKTIAEQQKALADQQAHAAEQDKLLQSRAARLDQLEKPGTKN